MFTDLVGSTALGDRLGDEAAQALRRAHDRIARQQFQRFAGRVIKGTGDGFLVAFGSARQGVECAIALQRAITTQHNEGRYAELQVRIGLHTGEPLADEDDLLGSDVNLAARIEAEAAGGQVFVSESTHVLARKTPDVRFAPLGERALKGFAEPVPIFEVCWLEEPARSARTRLVGRKSEQAHLRRQLEAAARGEGSLLMMAGEAGVGKTRLASELATYAADRGFTALTGCAYETEGMPPYLPFTEAVNQYIQSCTPESLRAHLDGGGPYVASLAPRLRTVFPDLTDPPAMEANAARYAMFENVCDLLLRIAAGSPLLLWLDDLHWADTGTLLLLQHLAPRLAGSGLLVLGAYRDTDIDDAHPLAGLLAEVTRQRLGSSLRLDRFGREQAAELVGAILGEAAAAHVVDALYDEAAGNPFFTEELVRHLREEGRDLTDPHAVVGDWDLPEGVRQVIARRLARLSSEANRALAYSSVLGRNLTLSKITAVTGLDDDTLLDLLDEAVSAHVLREEGDGYAFTHPLIAETLYRALSTNRRRRLHARVAEALEALYGTDLEAEQLAELAHQFFNAIPSAPVEKAIEYARRAGNRALAALAFEEAARFYRMALDALETQPAPDERERCELLLALGDAQWKAGDTELGPEAYLRAGEIAREIRAPDLIGRAALAQSRTSPQTDERLLPLLQAALEMIDPADSTLRAKVMAALSVNSSKAASFDSRDSLSREAMSMARRLGDAGTLSFALISRHGLLWQFGGPESIDEKIAIAREEVRLAEAAADKELSLGAHCDLLGDLVWLGEMAAADQELEAHERLAEELQQRVQMSHTLALRAMRRMTEGNFEEAERLANDALKLHRGRPLAAYIIQLFYLRKEQARLAELEAAVKGLANQSPLARVALAHIYAETGGSDEARGEVERLAADFATLRRDPVWLSTVALTSELCELLEMKDHAEALYSLLLPYVHLNVCMLDALVCYGPVARYLGLLASALGRWSQAERHFEEALEMNARMGARPLAAWTRHDYAEMLLARGGPGDREKAQPLLEESLATARELGMKALEAKAEATGSGRAPRGSQ